MQAETGIGLLPRIGALATAAAGLESGLATPGALRERIRAELPLGRSPGRDRARPRC